MNLPDIALSIQQPWAWLIAYGYKPIENRDWETSFRGWFLIHAGKKLDAAGYEWVRINFPDIPLPLPALLEKGGVVGLAQVIDCVEEHDSPWFFGDYGFVLANAQPLPFFPYKGQLKFFKAFVPGEVPDLEPLAVGRPRLANFHDYKSEAALTTAFGSNWLYVGRKNEHYGLAQSPLANPFVNDARAARGKVVTNPIASYKSWLWQQMKRGNQDVLEALAGIDDETVLVCWCHPEPCHAGVIDRAARYFKEQGINQNGK